MFRIIVTFLFLLFSIVLFAQSNSTSENSSKLDKKVVEAKFVDRAPIIDGNLDDAAWQNIPIATNFVMFRPTSGVPEPQNLKSEVKIAYDNEAIYFGAYLHDDKPEEIPMEFQTRDNFGSADFFGIVLNPQNDGMNQTEFFVMSTGNQNDAKVLPNGQEDWSWNAVWYSEVSLVDDGWIVEVKIPYSALRFSNEKIQTWGLNFHRRHEKTRDQYSWNFIPRDKGSIAQFDGELTGIENIKPPVRLSISPYASATLESFDGENDFNWSAGMDVKYGITENFTLDATLIPDFGQTTFDDVVLNLGPFEQRYSEQRQFFTEGLDLFSKGDFFYTRRVGNEPTGMDRITLLDNEIVDDNPYKVDMLNAIKVSGRTKGGLGIGVFNAITKKTEATIQNILDGTTRKVVTESLANYNVLVVDQQFNKNSSVSFVNTNVLRRGDFRDANVTSLLFDLKTKNSKYGVEGGVAMSNIYETIGKISGYEGVFEVGKVSGKHQYDLEFNFRDKNYDKNDLGFQRNNNYMNFESGYSYRIFEPKGKFNSYGIYFWSEVSYLMSLDSSSLSYSEKSNLYTGNGMGIGLFATTKKQFSFGADLNTGIGQQYDYYEPRAENRFYKENSNIGISGWLSSDYRKRLALNARFSYDSKFNDENNYIAFGIAPRYRINNNILLQYSFDFGKARNQKGYVTSITDGVIFGDRETQTIENSLSTKYNFNTKSAIGVNLRHYWSKVTYKDNYFLLEYDGTLIDNSYTDNHDINLNIWNFDLSYSWEFAPGSQLSLLYRNSIFNSGDDPDLSFATNIKNMFDEPLYNNFSLKLIYYLDYNKVKTWF